MNGLSIQKISREKGYLFITLESSSAAATELLGRLLAPVLPRGVFIGLTGPLGAGKTELVRGICDGFKLAHLVASPTYVLENIYESQTVTISHWDCYRLQAGADQALDIFDYEGDARYLILVEWPEQVPAIENLLAIKIMIDHAGLAEGSEHSRLICFQLREDQQSAVLVDCLQHSLKEN